MYSTEVCALTTNSLDEALGVVSAVVILHDDMFMTFVVSVAWAVADARVVTVWFLGARVIASFEGRNKVILNIVFNISVTLVLICLNCFI